MPPSSEDFIHRTTMLYHDDIIRIIYYNLIAIGMIAGVGFFLDLIRCLRLKSKKTLNNDEGKFTTFANGSVCGSEIIFASKRASRKSAHHS